jgi:hypothetical protein
MTKSKNKRPLTLDELAGRQERIINVLNIFFAILKRHSLVVSDDIKNLAKQDILTMMR